MLGAGGAERVLVTMANAFAKSYDVTVFTFNSSPDEVFYKIDDDVDVKYLNLLKETNGLIAAVRENLRRIKVLKKSIDELGPDLIVSFLPESNILVSLSSIGKQVPIILTEHTDPVGTKLGTAWEVLRRMAYRKADLIVVLNKSIKEYFEKKYNVPVVEIPNPVFLSVEDEPGTSIEITGPFIITIGRLVKNKRIEDIINGFARISNDFKEWKLVIVGSGPLKKDLQELAKSTGIGNRIIFTGLVRSPAHLLNLADLYVSASITEAFPMAICEAMASGLAVVVREYNNSVRDIIIDKKSGVIVDNKSQEQLIFAMTDLMGDKIRRKEIGLEAKKKMLKYTPEAVTSEWVKIFQKLTPESTV
jgi:glycosyltransferase involved in cell wall biosynthesis